MTTFFLLPRSTWLVKFDNINNNFFMRSLVGYVVLTSTCSLRYRFQELWNSSSLLIISRKVQSYFYVHSILFYSSLLHVLPFSIHFIVRFQAGQALQKNGVCVPLKMDDRLHDLHAHWDLTELSMCVDIGILDIKSLHCTSYFTVCVWTSTVKHDYLCDDYICTQYWLYHLPYYTRVIIE